MPIPTKPPIWLEKNIEFLGNIKEQMTLTFITKNGKAEIDKKLKEFFFEIKKNAQKPNTIGITKDDKPKVKQEEPKLQFC